MTAPVLTDDELDAVTGGCTIPAECVVQYYVTSIQSLGVAKVAFVMSLIP